MRSATGLVDRLLRGKAWVLCIGVLLAGIVFLNVSLLGLNSGIAVTADQAADLRRQNADLRLEVAKLGSTERIQRVAELRGFVMPAPGEVTYLDADTERDGRRAALALRKEGSRGEEVSPAVAGVAPEPEALPAAEAAGTSATPVPEGLPAAPEPEAPAEVPAPSPGSATVTAAPPE